MESFLCSGAGSVKGKQDREGTPLSRALRLGPNPAAVHFNKAPGQGKAEARTFVAPVVSRLELRELPEEPGEILGPDAHSGVLHLDLKEGALSSHG